MALVGIESRPIRVEGNPLGWSFQMRDDHGADVRVVITDLALDNIGHLGERLEVLAAHRSAIERLASAKHTAGKIEKDGTIKVACADVLENRFAFY